MIYNAASMPSDIKLGYVDENHWRPQPFDCSSFLEKHPGGVMTLWVRPQGADKAFPVALERGEGNVFVWTPLDEEITAKSGKLQLMCVDGTDVGKSGVSFWHVGDSIIPGAEHPENVPSWAAETIRRAEDAARRAEEAAESIDIDPETVAQAVAAYLDEHPITITETDPTVPQWAKNPTKPTYTAQEVGALPSDTPIPTVPTKVSAFENDAGYLTQHQSLAAYRTASAQDAIDVAQDTAISAKYTKPSGGIPKTDLAPDVQTSLGKADTALQEHQDISDKEDVTETVTMTAADTAVTLQKNKFYIWPEMAALTITCPATGGPFAFRFTSGSTATTLSLTGVTMPDDFSVKANTVYEINVYEGYGLAASWAVST